MRGEILLSGSFCYDALMAAINQIYHATMQM
jgi:hypothetical protein